MKRRAVWCVTYPYGRGMRIWKWVATLREAKRIATKKGGSIRRIEMEPGTDRNLAILNEMAK